MSDDAEWNATLAQLAVNVVAALATDEFTIEDFVECAHRLYAVTLFADVSTMLTGLIETGAIHATPGGAETWTRRP